MISGLVIGAIAVGAFGLAYLGAILYIA